MKKVLLLLVSMLLLLSSCARSEPKEPYTVDTGLKTLEIDPVTKTITDKYKTYQYTYQYSISKNTDGFTVTVIYPDGSTYFVTQKEDDSGTRRIPGHSEDYDAKRYISGHILIQALEDEFPISPFLIPRFTGDPVLGFLLIGLGILGAFWPRIIWWLTIGWLIKNAEPSNFALIAYRIIGVLLILFGIIKLFIE